MCIVDSDPALKEEMMLLHVTLSRLLWLYGVVLWWWAIVALLCTMCWLTRKVPRYVGTCDPFW
jgi:hypothetical protein